MNTLTRALLRRLHPAATFATAAALSCCSTAPVASSSSGGTSYSAREMAPAASLGTGWGESRDSRVTMTVFERAHSRPDGLGELHYTDADRFDYGHPFHGPRELAGGRVSVGVKTGWGGSLRGVERDGRYYILGERGARYDIVVRNLTRERIEVVVSVDGLDVLDGRSASYAKRGHLIGPRETITIQGWRTSSSSVAAFRFADVGDSYAARKYGDTRNVGVIGVAVFTEKHPQYPAFAQPPPGGREPNPFPGERWTRPPQG